jgi:hypothetical protein
VQFISANFKGITGQDGMTPRELGTKYGRLRDKRMSLILKQEKF